MTIRSIQLSGIFNTLHFEGYKLRDRIPPERIITVLLKDGSPYLIYWTDDEFILPPEPTVKP